MAETFQNSGGGTAPIAQSPTIIGDYIPSIDLATFSSGLGMVTPWGAGSTIRDSMLDTLSAGASEIGDWARQLVNYVSAPAGGDIINYNFEGLVGPMGVPGPAGPQGLPALPVLGGQSSIPTPTRVLDDGATPATVGNVAADALIQAVLVSWDANTETDLDHYNVYRHTSDASGSSVKILETYATAVADGNLTGGTEYFYWVKAVDHLENASTSYSTTASATPRNVETTDILSIEAAKVLIDGAVYLSNWRKTGDVTKIDGGEISANTVTATQISVANLAALNADLGTVTAGNIDALTINADTITAGTLVADRIVSATLTGVTTVGADSWDTLFGQQEEGHTAAGAPSTVDRDWPYFYVNDASEDYIQFVVEHKIASASGADYFYYKFYLKDSGGTKQYTSSQIDVGQGVTSFVLNRSAELLLGTYFSDDDKVIPGIEMTVDDCSGYVYGVAKEKRTLAGTLTK